MQGWDNETKTGGKLLLHCRKLILEKGGSIDVNGKGYKAGDKTHPQGYSIGNNSLRYGKDAEKLLHQANNGGGGSMGFYGAGGGYGSKGADGHKVVREGTCGGKMYGDAKKFKLNGTNVYLGSGGGMGAKSFGWNYAGNGGGAVVIKCDDAIIIEKGCKISANGCVKETRAGCGSGGSVYLHAPIVINRGKVSNRWIK